jgi:hypothetical protein
MTAETPGSLQEVLEPGMREPSECALTDSYIEAASKSGFEIADSTLD